MYTKALSSYASLPLPKRSIHFRLNFGSGGLDKIKFPS